MEKPEVRIIEPQQEESRIVDASQSERNYLLAKYGYKPADLNTENQQPTNPYSNMTYEEFSRLDDNNYRERIRTEQNRRNLPRAYTFDNVNYSESKFSNLDLDGHNLGIQVQIVSDMPINNERKL